MAIFMSVGILRKILFLLLLINITVVNSRGKCHNVNKYIFCFAKCISFQKDPLWQKQNKYLTNSVMSSDRKYFC